MRKRGVDVDKKERQIAACLGNTLFDPVALRTVSRWLSYAYIYNGYKAVQQQVDEEGCGAAICAARQALTDD